MTSRESGLFFGGTGFDIALSDIDKVRGSLGRFSVPSVSDSTLLETARYVYDFGKMLEEMAIPPTDIPEIIDRWIPDADELYPLLRKNAWGYSLGQAIKASRMERLEAEEVRVSEGAVSPGEVPKKTFNRFIKVPLDDHWASIMPKTVPYYLQSSSDDF